MGEEDPEGGQEWHDIDQVPTGTEVESLGKDKQGNNMPIRGKKGEKLIITKLGEKELEGTKVLVDDGTTKETHFISSDYYGTRLTFRAVRR